MPTTFKIYPDLQFVAVRYTGETSIADIRGLTQAVIADPRVTPDFRVIIDITGVQPTFSSADVVQHQQWRKQRPPFAKIAVVATTELEFGLARMFELASNSAGGVEMHTFRTVDDARQWLGLPALQAK
ncbi:MAG TPA: STAS/SEC14 domain-containing protein [bacterium]